MQNITMVSFFPFPVEQKTLYSSTFNLKLLLYIYLIYDVKFIKWKLSIKNILKIVTIIKIKIFFILIYVVY